MKTIGTIRRLITRAGSIGACLGPLLLAASAAMAHCDGIDGPVVTAAQDALAAGDVRRVLVWVQKADEDELRRAFEKTVAVRKLSAEARELADRYFFETVVRIHRAGEGAPFDGLKPAGRDLGPAIPAADRALETGSVEPVEKLLTAAVVAGVRERFREAQEAKAHAAHDVDAGRRYVRAYVTFIHHVERLFEAARARPHGHYHEAEPADAAARADAHRDDAPGADSPSAVQLPAPPRAGKH